VSGAAPAGRFVGQRVARREDRRLLTGRGRFVDDISLPGQLHVVFVRSPVAAGRIRRVDASQALALPGVEAVLTGADLDPLSGPLWTTTMGPPAFGPPLRPLALDDVRFVGDPVAVVVARTRAIAEDARDLVEVDIEPSPVVARIEDALREGAPLVHPELGTNVVEMPILPGPEVDAALAGAAHVVTRTFSMARMTNAPMEGRGLVAWWDAFTGECRVWASTQSPHEIKAFAARVLQVPEQAVRVEFGDVGGGFGQKMFPTRDEAAVLLAAKVVGRPLKWVEDRRENLVAANQARHDSATVTMALDADARIVAAKVEVTEDAGSYPAGGGTGSSAMLAALVFTGPYRIPHLAFSSRVVFTHTCGKAPFRGPWAIETIAREQMIDAVAAEIGIDPLELRRRNVIHTADLPHSLPSGLTYDVVTPQETLEQAVAMLGWDAFRAEQASARSEGRHLGVGLSLCIEPSAVAMGAWATEQAVVRVGVSGGVEVLLGTGSHGHSLETTIPQVVADHLGCALDDVTLRQGGDTPYGPGTGGSRSAVIAGGAAQAAATTLRTKVTEIASHLLEAAPEDLEVADSRVWVRGTPTRGLSFAEIAGTAYLNPDALPPGVEPGLEASARYKPPSTFTWSNACHCCVVEVDPETGKTEILRYIVSEDCGVMINPMVVEGQIAGGVAQGIGEALYEEMAYDDHGNPLAATFLDYLVPSAAEVPSFEYGHIETPSSSLGGYKGMGEGGAIASPAAVANAVNDALRGLAAPVDRLPITPWRIVEAIAQAPSEGGGGST